MEQQAQHTPGPWFADEHGNIWRRDPQELYENGGGVAGDKALATTHVGWHGECVGFPVKANARLIAAAPELLEALEAEEEWRAREATGALDPEWNYETMVAAKHRAAIARATQP